MAKRRSRRMGSPRTFGGAFTSSSINIPNPLKAPGAAIGAAIVLGLFAFLFLIVVNSFQTFRDLWNGEGVSSVQAGISRITGGRIFGRAA